MTHPSAARVDDGALELVPPLAQRALEVGDEGAELGRSGPRVHLRDEQDPHGLARRDLDDAEAHLVRRSLAPEDVARRSAPQARIVAAGDAQDVAGACGDGLPQLVHGLPVEVPARDLEEELRARGARVEPHLDRA